MQQQLLQQSETTYDVRMSLGGTTLAKSLSRSLMFVGFNTGALLVVIGQDTILRVDQALESADIRNSSIDYANTPIFELKAPLVPNYLRPEFTGISIMLGVSIILAVYSTLNYGNNGLVAALAPLGAAVLGLASFVILGREDDRTLVGDA